MTPKSFSGSPFRITTGEDRRKERSVSLPYRGRRQFPVQGLDRVEWLQKLACRGRAEPSNSRPASGHPSHNPAVRLTP